MEGSDHQHKKFLLHVVFVIFVATHFRHMAVFSLLMATIRGHYHHLKFRQTPWTLRGGNARNPTTTLLELPL